jgi:hypothetical protein
MDDLYDRVPLVASIVAVAVSFCALSIAWDAENALDQVRLDGNEAGAAVPGTGWRDDERLGFPSIVDRDVRATRHTEELPAGSIRLGRAGESHKRYRGRLQADLEGGRRREVYDSTGAVPFSNRKQELGFGIANLDRGVSRGSTAEGSLKRGGHTSTRRYLGEYSLGELQGTSQQRLDFDARQVTLGERQERDPLDLYFDAVKDPYAPARLYPKR